MKPVKHKNKNFFHPIQKERVTYNIFSLLTVNFLLFLKKKLDHYKSKIKSACFLIVIFLLSAVSPVVADIIEISGFASLEYETATLNDSATNVYLIKRSNSSGEIRSALSYAAARNMIWMNYIWGVCEISPNEVDLTTAAFKMYYDESIMDEHFIYDEERLDIYRYYPPDPDKYDPDHLHWQKIDTDIERNTEENWIKVSISSGGYYAVMGRTGTSPPIFPPLTRYPHGDVENIRTHSVETFRVALYISEPPYWEDEPDIWHYNIYRSTHEGGPYTFLKREYLLWPQGTFRDSDIEKNTTYYYRVTAVAYDELELWNAMLIESRPTDEISVYIPPNSIPQITEIISPEEGRAADEYFQLKWIVEDEDPGDRMTFGISFSTVGPDYVNIFNPNYHNVTFAEGASPALFSPSESVESGSTVTFTSPEPLPDGSTVYYQLGVTDGKEASVTEIRTFYIKVEEDITPPQITDVVVYPDPFTPDGDKHNDILTLSYTIDKAATVTVSIHDTGITFEDYIPTPNRIEFEKIAGIGHEGPDKFRASYIEVHGDYLYAAGELDGFTILNIENLEGPEIETLKYKPESNSRIFTFSFVGDTVYLPDSNNNALWKVDASNPSSPEVVDVIENLFEEHPMGYAGLVVKIDRSSDLAYISNGLADEEIQIIDLEAFEKTDTINLGRLGLLKMVIEDNYIYGALAGPSFSGNQAGLMVINLEDKTSEFVFLDNKDRNHISSYIDVDIREIGDKKYAVTVGNGIPRLIDITNPAEPQPVPPENIFDPVFSGEEIYLFYQGAVYGNYYLYSTSSDRPALGVGDLSNPDQPFVLEAYEWSKAGVGLDVRGNYAFVGFNGDFYEMAENFGLDIVKVNMPGTNNIVWDGRNWLGDIVSDGDYSFTITAEDTSGNIAYYYGSVTVGIKDIIPPAAVTDLEAEPGEEEGEINLTWTAPGDDGDVGTAASYIIKYASFSFTGEDWDEPWLTEVPGTPQPQEAGSAESMTVKELTGGVTYWFALKTEDTDSNISEISNIVSAPAKSVPPEAPQNLAASVKEYGWAVELTWTPSISPDVKEHRIYRATETFADKLLDTLTSDASYYYDNTITENTSYYYQVTAVDEADNESDPAQVFVYPSIAPAKVGGFYASLSGEPEWIELSWDANIEPDLDHYYLERSQELNFYSIQMSTQTTDTLYWDIDPTLEEGNTYYYRISAYDIVNNASPYNKIKAIVEDWENAIYVEIIEGAATVPAHLEKLLLTFSRIQIQHADGKWRNLPVVSRTVEMRELYEEGKSITVATAGIPQGDYTAIKFIFRKVEGIKYTGEHIVYNLPSAELVIDYPFTLHKEEFHFVTIPFDSKLSISDGNYIPVTEEPVTKFHNFEFSVSPSTAVTTTAQTAEYDLTITNTGTEEDSYGISVSTENIPLSWIEVSSITEPIAPGDSLTVPLKISVPEDYIPEQITELNFSVSAKVIYPPETEEVLFFPQEKEVPALLRIIPDSLPPRTRLLIGEPNYITQLSTYIVSATQLELEAVDDLIEVGDEIGLGVDTTKYRINDGEWVEYVEPFSIPAEGVHALNFYSVDAVGNTEEIKEIRISVDNTSPVSELSSEGPLYENPDTGSIYVSSLTVHTLTSEDPVSEGVSSGVDYASYRINNTLWTDIEGPEIDFTLPPLKEGIRTVSYYAGDNVENTEEMQQKTFHVDTTPPRTLLELVGEKYVTDEKIYINAETAVKLIAEDIESEGVASGVKDTFYRIDDEQWKSYTEKFTLEEGVRTVEYYSLDNVENTEEINTFVLYVDDTPPVSKMELVGAVYETEEKTYINERTQVKLAAFDPEIKEVSSGIREIRYSINNSGYTVYNSTFTLNEGIYSIQYYAVDNVGNIEQIRQKTLYVDGTPPVTEISVGKPYIEVFDEKIISPRTPITLTAYDPEVKGVDSGVNKILYRLNSGEWKIYTEEFTLNEGKWLIEYSSIDNVENKETVKSVTCTVTYLTDYAAYAHENLKIAGNGEVLGSVRSAGDIKLSGNAFVDGDVQGATVTLSGNNVEVTGDITESAEVISPWSINLKEIEERVKENNDNHKLDLKDGILKASDRDEITVTSGTYYLKGLEASGRSRLIFDGKVEIFLAGELKVTGRAKLETGEDPYDLIIFSNFFGTDKISGQGSLKSIVYAPKKLVSVSGNGLSIGNVLARKIEVTGNSTIKGAEYEEEKEPATVAAMSSANLSSKEKFEFGEVFSYPNPARMTDPTLHIQAGGAGGAERVEIRIYNIAAELVKSTELNSLPENIDGKYAYEYKWNVSNVASGVYIYHIRATRDGKEITETGKLAVIR